MPTTSFRIPPDVKEDIDAIVHARDAPDTEINRTDVFIDALEDYIERHEDEVEKGWEKAGKSRNNSNSGL